MDIQLRKSVSHCWLTAGISSPMALNSTSAADAETPESTLFAGLCGYSYLLTLQLKNISTALRVAGT